LTVLENITSTEYCESEGTRPWQQWISNVTFNTINNDSGKDKYGDYTSNLTNVNPRVAYPFSITASFSWENWDEYVRVWIDYNGDLDFNDAGEMVFEQVIPGGANGSSTQSTTGTITIPVNATPGNKRMRVAMKQAAFADPCETFDFGEVEDYTIQINQNENASRRENLDGHKPEKSFTLFPNPAKEAVFLNLKGDAGKPATIQIYNALGEKVAEQQMAALPDELIHFDLSNYGNGLYLVSVQIDNGKRMVKRLVVKKVY